VHVLAVKKVLTTPIFSNLLKFETERDKSQKNEMKFLDLQEIYQFDLRSFVVSRSVQKLPRFKKLGAVNPLSTASTISGKSIALSHMAQTSPS